MSIKTEIIHLIFKTHLDIGFTGLAQNVAQTYFDTFIPSAIETANKLKGLGSSDRFIWTTGSWLIYEYLEQGTPKQRKALENAIESGDIRWHGLPFTTHSELMDASLFKYGLSLSQQLDKRFGKTTIAAKMTDVPGHTRGIVPLLSEAGIRFLHIGVNEASTPPDVPPTFLWRDTGSDTSVVVMYQKGGYGGLIRIPGLAHTLAFAHTNDNHGAQSLDEVQKIFTKMRRQFPEAQIIGSTLDAFASHLVDAQLELPVVQQELGDTWIHGVGSDPEKVSRYRELTRLRRHWLDTGLINIDDQKLAAFSRKILLIPEHTWGMDEKVYLKDYTHYEQAAFQTARATEVFRKFESSWVEQRAYVDEAVMALGNSVFGKQAKDRLQAIRPKKPNTNDYEVVQNKSIVFDTSHFEIGFDAQTGAIKHLLDKRSQRNWASEMHMIGLLRYQTFSQMDYDHFWKHYIINKRSTRGWSWDDYTKPGMEFTGTKSRFWLPQLTNLYMKQTTDGQMFLLELTMEEEASNRYGCPNAIFVQVEFPDDRSEIHFDLQWFDKQASRLPEAVWFSFQPMVSKTGKWSMDKLGTAISPLEVIKNGNRKLHAVDTGVFYQDSANQLQIETLDAPLVAPGEPSLLNFNNRQPNTKNGMHFNLLNNVWGTNYVMWIEGDARFRFNMAFGQS